MRVAFLLLALLFGPTPARAEEKWDIEVLLAKATPIIREVLKQEAHVIQGANMQIDFIREENLTSNDPNFKRRPLFPSLKEIKKKIAGRPYWRIGVGVRELIPQGGYIFYFSREGEYLGVYKYS